MALMIATALVASVAKKVRFGPCWNADFVSKDVADD